VIDFRYHIVSLVAVFLALGVGIVLGSGPLDEQIQGALQTQTDDLRSQQKELRSQVSDLQHQVAVGEQFAQELEDPLTANQLTDRSVVIFTLPGADNDIVDEAAKLLERSGATVNGTVGITDVYVDPTKAKAPLEDLALRLVPPGVEFPDGATPIERVGTVLARATVASERQDTQEVDQRAAEVLAGLQELGAIEVTGEPGKRSDLAVVVAPAPAKEPVDSEAGKAADDALLGLVAALDAGGRGAVVTGPPEAAEAGGFVNLVRRSDDQAQGVSTDDLADSSMGEIGLVLALVEQTRGAAGDYGGGDGVDSVIPNISGSGGS
jgi:Copper transport outer membrane protein, MctB